MTFDALPQPPSQDTAQPSAAAPALYGREAQLRQLVDALVRVRTHGSAELVLIYGPAGSGKSALAEALAHAGAAAGRTAGSTAGAAAAIAAEGASGVAAGVAARYVAGKCDLQHHDIPYASLAQALHALTRQALNSPPAEREELRLAWLAALAGQARAVAEILPEMHHVLGATAPLPTVPAPQAQRRALDAILATLSVFASRAVPLVLLLDDIQWADSSTLAFLQAYIARPPRHLLIVATCRDAGSLAPATDLNWLDHAHRTHTLPITRIALAPLDENALSGMIAAQLHTAPANIAGLGAAMHRITDGNPFHAQQLLRALLDDGVLRRQGESAVERGTGERGAGAKEAGEVKAAGAIWTWDIQRLADCYAGGVTGLMARRIGQLPASAAGLLGHLACLGARARTTLLADIATCHETDIDADLAALVNAKLLVHTRKGYAFTHDRFLEAAYGTVPEQDRPARHAHIAHAMILHYGDRLAEHAFDISNQIERAAGHPLTETRQVAFVQALVVAGRRAKDAAALAQAVRHVDAAHALMRPDWWRRHKQLAYEASLLRCECLIAQAELPLAEREIDGLLARILPVLDRAAVYRLKAELQTVQSDYEGAIATALSGLDMLGVRLDRNAGATAWRQARDAVTRARAGRDIASLAQLPLTDDRRVHAAMGLLSTLISSLFVKDNLCFLHVAKMVELTLTHGITPHAPYGMAWFGVFIADIYEEYEDGLAYGMVAKDLVDRHRYDAERMATLVAAGRVSTWTRPLWFSLDQVRGAVQQGWASGAPGMACYATYHLVCDLLSMGEALRLVDEEIERGLALTRLVRYRDIELILLAQRRFVRAMQGRLEDDATTPALAERLAQSRSQPTRFRVALYEGMIHAYLGAWEPAKAALSIAHDLAWAAPAHINVAECKFFLALALARTRATDGDCAARMTAVAALRDRVERWAALNPLTFRGKLLLIEAELARLRDEPLAALALHEQAIQAAQLASFPQEEAMAHELAAQLCDSHGLRTAAGEHLRAAEAGYRRLDGEHKADQVGRAYRECLTLHNPRRAVSGREQEAGWASGLKAAQALSGEVVMERLLESLMTNIVTYAGAQYGLLVLMGPTGPMVEASARVLHHTVSVHLGSSVPTENALPMTVLHSVLRTRQTLALADATQQAPSLQGLTDPPRLLRSVLCLPLQRGGELIGVFYLENNAAPGVFDETHIEALEVLAPQLAITLQTAQLYERLISENDRRARAELDLRNARADLARTSHLTVMGSLAASIAHEVNQPLTAIASSMDAGVRWLKRATPNIEEALDAMAHARQNAMRAAEIIRALRSLAKEAPAVLEPLLPDAVLEEVLQMVRMDIDARGVRLHSHLHAGPATIDADRVQLQQVVLNLIINALDAMADTPLAERELEVSSALRDGRIEISVKDRGPGIAAETLPRIFDAFYTTKTHGMGMGLAICHSIVEAHGGTLEVRARSGGGMAFWFQLPASLPAAPPAGLPENRLASRPAESAPRPPITPSTA
ncbi:MULTISPECIES: AAA family ATPase [unclassified Achromobacter]|uniref:trifunctional serine/threonine-protein kinase/ATP-binding protein/sensor histidine kinase n=1 Tax=unclassified Achromobacter TaxID=2626865 RepID=UPI000B51B663|nr:MULTISPECIES: AAA family ATPase [unclassified Achromobacter]OWT71518.1 histidine kinase [Achromobacter sp. HZ34]OWT73175.1 histidine kinase [Achromobacter sp. HZ28]